MGYECQNFKNGQVLTAECLNRMDQGIKQACDSVPPACDKKDRSKILSHGEKGHEWIDYPVLTADDAAAGDKAWSSKITVDRLCPAFSESGVLIQCEPVEGYPLEVVATGAVDSLRVTACGKNLYDAATYELIDGYYINKGNGAEAGVGTHAEYCATREYIPVVHLRGKHITLNHPAGGNAPGMAFYDRDQVYLGTSNGGGGDGGKGVNTLVPDNAWYMRFCTYMTQKSTVQIEIGGTATDYEPYCGNSADGDGSKAAVTAVKGTNTVFAYSGDNAVEITVTGRADPITLINSLISRVAELEKVAVGNT